LNKQLQEHEKSLEIKENDNNYQQYITVKKEIEQINNHITKGVIIRAQAKFTDQNESNTKLFLGLEKSRAKTKNMSSLTDDNGITITEPSEILAEEKKFFENLYSSKMECQGTESQKAKEYFLTEPTQRVRDTDQIALDKQITSEEIAEALKQLPTHKSPGGDGFPVDFYKKKLARH
jgi:hypothetical protein